MPTGSDCLALQNQIGQLRTQTLYLPRLEAGPRGPGAGRAGPPCARRPLPVSSRGRPSVRVCVLFSSSYKDTHPVGSGLTL